MRRSVQSNARHICGPEYNLISDGLVIESILGLAQELNSLVETHKSQKPPLSKCCSFTGIEGDDYRCFEKL